jgi:RHS repeat-associated protein
MCVQSFATPQCYSASGSPIGNSSAIGNRFTFTGREWRSRFGFYEYRARAYNPTLGRFMSEDPKGFDTGDYNLYRYCNNDPLDVVNPMGLDAAFTLLRDFYEDGANPRLSAGTLRVTEKGRFVAAIRVNGNGFYEHRQGVPEGHYLVLPKKEDGVSFKKGTPAVTSPELKDKPGATTAGHPEGSVLNHGEGPKGKADSKACITCDPAGLKILKEIFKRNENGTILDVHNGPRIKDGKPEIRKAIPVEIEKEGGQ